MIHHQDSTTTDDELDNISTVVGSSPDDSMATNLTLVSVTPPPSFQSHVPEEEEDGDDWRARIEREKGPSSAAQGQGGEEAGTEKGGVGRVGRVEVPQHHLKPPSAAAPPLRGGGKVEGATRHTNGTPLASNARAMPFPSTTPSADPHGGAGATSVSSPSSSSPDFHRDAHLHYLRGDHVHSVLPMSSATYSLYASNLPDRRLNERERRLALMFRNGRDKRSIVPILYFLAASLGKLILGFGVSLAIKGSYADNKTSFGVGVGLAIAGFMGVVAAALGFGAAASRIDRRLGIAFKCFSIGGGSMIALGYALKQYFVSDDKPIFSVRLSFIPLAVGTASMGISLPNFTAFTELYRGRIWWVSPRYRSIFAFLCMSPSLGALFGGWISSENAHWPSSFNAVVLTFVVALGYAGVSIFWSDNLRLKAELLELRLCKEEEEEDEGVGGRASSAEGSSSASPSKTPIPLPPGMTDSLQQRRTRRGSLTPQTLVEETPNNLPTTSEKV